MNNYNNEKPSELFLSNLAKELDIPISRKNIHNLYNFIAALKSYSSKVNLVSRNDREFLFERHVIPSLVLIKFIDKIENKVVYDIGSGAGFPGFPLKIMVPSIDLISIEARRKKTKFQEKIKEVLELNKLLILNRSVQELKADILNNLPTADIIVSRAMGNTKAILDFAEKKLNKNGLTLIYRGEKSLFKSNQTEQKYMQKWFETIKVVDSIYLRKPIKISILSIKNN